jgi:hypothetical protein
VALDAVCAAKASVLASVGVRCWDLSPIKAFPACQTACLTYLVRIG